MNHLMQTVAALALTTAAFSVPAGAIEVVAAQSQTVQAQGPRAGEGGSKYFNIQGKENDKFASFGLLVFEIPADVQASKIKSVTLILVQSVPKFAKDGQFKVFLAPDLDPKADLKFDSTVPDGIGTQIKMLHELGAGTFKTVETGKTDTLSLAVDDILRERIGKGGKMYLAIAPADPTVAATYFGANESATDKSPKLTIELP